MVVLVLMGVCGCGKTSVGRALASKLGYEFSDADDFHSEDNKHKMRQGIPLTDEDRLPWLQSIRQYILRQMGGRCSTVVSCSALKRRYRDVLSSGEPDIIFVHLTGPDFLIRARMEERSEHFMPVELLTSQLQTLEAPAADENHVTVDISGDLNATVDRIIRILLSGKESV